MLYIDTVPYPFIIAHVPYNFLNQESPCDGFEEVLDRYKEITPHIKLSGPTSFAPAISKAIEIVKQTNQVRTYRLAAVGVTLASLDGIIVTRSQVSRF